MLSHQILMQRYALFFNYGTFWRFFLNFFLDRYVVGIQFTLSDLAGAAFTRQQSLLGGHDQLTSVVQVAVHVVSTVHHMHGASSGIDGHVRGFSLVMCSSLSASGMRLSSFRMCHFFVILTS